MRENISDAKVREKESTIKYLNERSECFFLRHRLTKATTEDIFYSRKTLESNPKNETFSSFEAQHNLFSRLLTVSKTRTVDLRSTPLSISYSIGEQRKSAKSKLLHQLEVKWYSIKTVGFHHNFATILDFTVIIQSIIQ